ncbi:cytochrome P450 2J6-like isoform X2 [Lytechinus variegatus]|uniref:cytochrome P450 2J6-like isoform X2 n=1 Tax=Lytechinus variegatus TaxID=7654 RepID=UPI001BB27FBE|nr:cytochrome P450 2J6-like isoform X2 [Lytechinus variegatus]
MATIEFITENIGSFLVFVITFIILFTILKSKLSFNIPKGPTALPILGNILSLKQHDELLKLILDWCKEYGSIYSLYFGRRLFVVVNGLDAIKEITTKTGLDFADRNDSVAIRDINPNRRGLFDTRADEEWKRQRKFAHTTLRGMGFGKVSLEPLIQTEARHAMDYFKSKFGSKLDPSIAFGVTSSNVINKLVFNHRNDHGSESGDELMRNVRDLMVADEGALLTLFPFLWPVLRYASKWRRLDNAWRKIKVFFNQQIDIREKRMDACEGELVASDFLDAYLIQRRSEPNNYSLDSLDLVLVDLFLAGTDTVSTTMTWAVIYLANNPEIQQKIHDEIINEIGLKEVSLSHRSGLNYTQAALIEVQRLATVAPLVPREAARDADLCGHRLPKGTALLINLWSLHHDPDVWKDPSQFNPDRFLNNDGTLVKQPDNFLPFSAGKRMCMGDQLAKMELFIFFTSMVQQIKFTIPSGDGPLPMDGLLDLARKPKPFQVQVSAWSN